MENLNVLEQLVIKETNKVKNIQPTEVKISFLLQNRLMNTNEYVTIKNLEKVTIIFRIGNIEIHSPMNRIFIHQLGQRVLKRFYSKEYADNPIFNTTSENYQAVSVDWHFEFNDNREQLRKYCEATLSDNHERLVIKYYEVDKKYVLYGIVSSSYKEMKQTLFRDMVLKSLNNQFAGLQITPYNMQQTNRNFFAPVRENFCLNVKHRFNFEMDLTVNYGLNNGYKSYSFYMRRYTTKTIINFDSLKQNQQVPYTSVPIEKINVALKDGITTYITNSIKELLQYNNYRLETKEILSILSNETELGLNWRNNPRYDESHNQETDISKFLEKVFIRIFAYCFDFENKIKVSKSKYYDDSQISQFFRLMRIAQSSERRVQDKIEELQNTNGKTYYNISEAFREVGTFEKAIARPVQRFLIEVGTKFIEEENYLESCIEKNDEIIMTGDYSFIDS